MVCSQAIVPKASANSLKAPDQCDTLRAFSSSLRNDQSLINEIVTLNIFVEILGLSLLNKPDEEEQPVWKESTVPDAECMVFITNAITDNLINDESARLKLLIKNPDDFTSFIKRADEIRERIKTA